MRETFSTQVVWIRQRRLGAALVGLLLIFSGFGGVLSWAQGDGPADTITAVETAARSAALAHPSGLDTALGSALARRSVLISNTQVDGAKGFGAVVYPVPDNEKGMPYAMFYIAHQVNGRWQVALEYTPLFYALLADLPPTLIGAEHKALLLSGSSLDSTQGDASLQLNFPFPVGETWAMTGGPHHRLGSAGKPWGATDWNWQNGGAGHSIRSARNGTVTVLANCLDFVRIDHGGGVQTTYYHVANIAVSNGQNIGRHHHLGVTSTQSRCGGSAFGPHVHFAPLVNGGEVNINGHDIGGWTILEGANQYDGCLRRVSTGEQRCRPNAVVTNEGHVGSGVMPTAPANANLVKNWTFNEGTAHWSRHGNHTGWAVYNEGGNNFLAWKGETGGSLAAVYQILPYSVPANSTMELRMRLGNTSNVPKRVRAHIVRNTGAGNDWQNMAVCDFTIPAKTPLRHYMVRDYTTRTWEQIGVWIEGYPMDSVPDILMDDVLVHHYPTLALTKDECFAPSSNVNWNMRAPRGLQGWYLVNHLVDPKVTSGGTGIWMRVVNRDPMIYSPSLINVRAEDHPTLHIRMASTSDACGQIFFMKPGQAPAEERSVKFTVKPDGQTYDYILQMHNHPQWSGEIAQLRFDPANCGTYNASLGNAIAIAEIQLHRRDIVNVGFETAGTAPRFADKWIHNNPETDRRVCQTGIGRTGLCAYRFRPGTRPGQVVQRINSFDGRAGDVLSASAWVRTNNAYSGGGVIILRVDYTDGTSERLRLPVPKSLTYTQIRGELKLKKPVKNVRFIMQRAVTMRGMFLVDDVNLSTARLNRGIVGGLSDTPADDGLIPLPAAPTEGQDLRGN